jgi:hypothetical protein
MAWTRHGHHIPGTILGTDRPSSVARCGGPGLCDLCSRDASVVLKNREKQLELPNDDVLIVCLRAAGFLQLQSLSETEAASLVEEAPNLHLFAVRPI